jgi:Ran GTPase-activating protein (RanGAP) involved in mRNA processing and transport
VSKWAKYPGDIPDFLGQCYVACRRAVDAPRAELGDIGARTFEALMAAIELPQTSVTTWSNFFCGYPISISKLDARFNRLDNSAGLLFAQTLLQNRSLSVVDLRFNDVDDAAGVDVGAALRVNDALTTLSLAHNRFGPATGAALGAALRRNGTLKTLNVAHNMLGPRLRWQNKHQRIFIESSATLLFMALAKNSALTALDVSDNALGAEAAKGLDFALRKNPQSALRTVNLAGNELRDAGGRALAHVLKQDKCNLTSLDCSRNRMGAVVGVALAAALRKNKRLVHLDVSSNGLSTKGGRAIALALAEDNRILVGLNCESNGLGPDALRAFSQCLSKNPTLTHLDLALNALSTSTYDGGDVDGVGGVLGAALAKNSTLTFLDLRGFTLESEELMLALQGFGKNKGLCRVNLDSQPFTNANVLQLTNALEQHRVRDRCEYGDVPRGAGALNARDRALERRRQAKVGKAQAAPKILVDAYIARRRVCCRGKTRQEWSAVRRSERLDRRRENGPRRHTRAMPFASRRKPFAARPKPKSKPNPNPASF